MSLRPESSIIEHDSAVAFLLASRDSGWQKVLLSEIAILLDVESGTMPNDPEVFMNRQTQQPGTLV